MSERWPWPDPTDYVRRAELAAERDRWKALAEQLAEALDRALPAVSGLACEAQAEGALDAWREATLAPSHNPAPPRTEG